MKSVASSLWAALWRSLALFTVFVLSVVCAALVESALGGPETPAKGLLLEAIPFLGLLAGTVALVRFVPPRGAIRAGLAPRQAAVHLTIGVLIGLIWIGGAVLILNAVASVSLDLQRLSLNSATTTAAVAMLTNVGMQQLLTRGYIFGVVEWKFGWISAVITTSLLFLLLHPGAFEAGPVAIANVLSAGLIFGLARVITGSLYFATGLHLAWNFTGAVVLGLIPLGTYPSMEVAAIAGPEVWIGSSQGMETGLAVTLVNGVLLLGLLLLWLYRRPSLETSRNGLKG